jgi:small subunit ribosomal protein S12e
MYDPPLIPFRLATPSSSVPATWAGLRRIGKDGKHRKVTGCGCVVVKDYGVDSEGMPVFFYYVRAGF